MKNTICPRCQNTANTLTVDTQFGGAVTFTVCSHCDRAKCTVCKKPDMSGVKKECCGKSMAIPVQQ
jgi:hypothetical protein